MIDIDIPDDISGLPVYTPKQAQQRVDSENRDREDEAELANAGGDMDDFRYLSPRWFILDSNHGQFVVTIKSACGGGRASAVDDGKDYCNAELSYNLHARVEQEQGFRIPGPSTETGTQTKENGDDL